MSEPSAAASGESCSRCKRDLSGEKPVLLPDARNYCAACCDRMATDSFEMETGVPFVPWIEKHPELVMQHQPMEMNIRRIGFLLPVAFTVLGLLLGSYGIFRIAAGPSTRSEEPVASKPGQEPFEKIANNITNDIAKNTRAGLGYLAIGLGSCALFGWLSFRQGKAFWRARDFRLTLRDGVFQLSYGPHKETFTLDDVKQACIVRPGTVGASEGALGLADGRMLTLDTCLTDLHALGVVMDLRFREDFPPSQEDLARERRNKLRKIRGLS